MRVRILSGNQAGGVTDVPQIEGEVLVATGYAEVVTEDLAPPVVDESSAPDPPPADPSE